MFAILQKKKSVNTTFSPYLIHPAWLEINIFLKRRNWARIDGTHIGRLHRGRNVLLIMPERKVRRIAAVQAATGIILPLFDDNHTERREDGFERQKVRAAVRERGLIWEKWHHNLDGWDNGNHVPGYRIYSRQQKVILLSTGRLEPSGFSHHRQPIRGGLFAWRACCGVWVQFVWQDPSTLQDDRWRRRRAWRV
jgi:hypothetical protein